MDRNDNGDRLSHFLVTVAAVALGVLIGGYILLLIWSHLGAAVSAVSTSSAAPPAAAAPPTLAPDANRCLLQPPEYYGTTVSVQVSGTDGGPMCAQLIAAGYQLVAQQDPNAEEICSAIQPGVLIYVYDAGANVASDSDTFCTGSYFPALSGG
jgi:hypothetical protein